MPGSDTIYLAKKPTVLTNPTSATVFTQADNSSKAAAIYIPDQWVSGQSSVVTGQAIGSLTVLARAWGRMTGGTTTNFTPVIQYGVSTTAGSNTSVAAATARACNSTSSNWFVEAQFVWDFTSKRLDGAFWALNGSAGTLDAQAATTQVTSVDLSTSGNGFVVTALFSATNAGNLAYLDGMSLSVVS